MSSIVYGNSQTVPVSKWIQGKVSGDDRDKGKRIAFDQRISVSKLVGEAFSHYINTFFVLKGDRYVRREQR